MDLLSGAIQSYQKNQNLAGWASQVDATAATSKTEIDLKNTDTEDSVSISQKKQIYDWLAQEFPLFDKNPVNLNRVSQHLHEYQILNFNDLNKLNSLLKENPDQNVFDALQNAITNTSSFKDKQQLNHLNQVFSTLSAADTHPTA